MLPPAGKCLTGCVCRPDGEKQGIALFFTFANVSILFQSYKAGSGLLARAAQNVSIRQPAARLREMKRRRVHGGCCGRVAARNFIPDRDAISCPTDARGRRVTGREKGERCRNPSERTEIKRLIPYSRLPEPHGNRIPNLLGNISQPVGKYFSTRWEFGKSMVSAGQVYPWRLLKGYVYKARDDT